MDQLDRLSRLEDLEAIRQLKMRYARCCDAGYDAKGIAELFVEDGIWDGGALFGRCEGRDSIRRHFADASSRIPWSLHYILAPELTVADDGARAAGSWYLWQPCVRIVRGVSMQAWLAGTYRDTYRKLAGTWLFDTVVVEARWLDAPPQQPALT